MAAEAQAESDGMDRRARETPYGDAGQVDDAEFAKRDGDARAVLGMGYKEALDRAEEIEARRRRDGMLGPGEKTFLDTVRMLDGSVPEEWFELM